MIDDDDDDDDDDDGQARKVKRFERSGHVISRCMAIERGVLWETSSRSLYLESVKWFSVTLA